MSRVYAGVGAREAPGDMLMYAQMLAERLADEGWTLRSGHAPGMDQAFESGAGRRAEVYLPWPSFEDGELLDADVIVDKPSREAYELAERYHPTWERLGSGAKRLHARNSHQVLGLGLNDPSRFVLCWTAGAKTQGGTGQTLRLAEAYDIPVFNLADDGVFRRINEFLKTDVNAI